MSIKRKLLRWMPWKQGRAAIRPAPRQSTSLRAFKRELHCLFDDLFNELLVHRIRSGLPSPLASPDAMMGTHWPSVTVKESEDAVHVSAELPGIDENDIEVRVGDDDLIIRGRKGEHHAATPGTYHMVETCSGDFHRAIPLPASIKSEKAEAHYAHGVLTVVLPKSESSSPRKIKVHTE